MFTTKGFPKPALENLYIADSSGGELKDKISLYTYEQSKVKDIAVATNEIEIYNFPNPFSSTTIIAFRLPSSLDGANTEVKIYDENGNLVAHVFENRLNAGNYQVRWDGRNSTGAAAPSGIYFYSVKIGDQLKTEKMTLIR
ncbi:MAG: FlgD immunoglobulin-like domain containing protein [FCB group bacterium]